MSKYLAMTKEELKGKKVGVQIGTVQEEFTKNIGGIPQLYNSWTGALMDLQNNKIDAVMVGLKDVIDDDFLASFFKRYAKRVFWD